MLHSILILRYGLYRAGLLTRYRHVYYSMIGTALVALAAVDAEVMVYHSLAVILLVVGNGVLGTVHGAAAGHTATAEVGYLIVGLNA